MATTLITEKFLSEFTDVMVRLQDANKALNAKLAAIQELCRKHNHPGCNVGAHGLAGDILAIVEGEQ